MSATAQRRLLWAGVWTFLALYLFATLGLVRYARGMSGAYDLGIFTQGAHGWVSAGYPVSAIKGGSLFGDHFSPVTILFGLGYAVWPDPRSLIVVHAVTLAIAVGMLADVARQRLGGSPRAALVLAALLLGLPLVSAAIATPHETGLGAPLYAGLGIAFYRQRYAAALAWAAATLLVKEDSGLVVAAVGAAWFLAYRHARQALTFIGLGALGFVVSNVVIWLVRGEGSAYYSFITDSVGGLDPARAIPSVLLLASCGLVVRDPFLLVAVPGIAWRTVSGNRNYWVPDFHYDVVTGVVAALVLTHALHRGLPVLRRRVVAVGVAVAAGLVTIAGETPWRAAPLATPRKLIAVERLLAVVPPGQPLAADQSTGAYVPAGREAAMFAVARRGTLALSPTSRACWVLLEPAQGDLSGSATEKAAWLTGRRVVWAGAVAMAATGRTGCSSWLTFGVPPRWRPTVDFAVAPGRRSPSVLAPAGHRVPDVDVVRSRARATSPRAVRLGI